jgi:hypothetical protein
LPFGAGGRKSSGLQTLSIGSKSQIIGVKDQGGSLRSVARLLTRSSQAALSRPSKRWVTGERAKTPRGPPGKMYTLRLMSKAEIQEYFSKFTRATAPYELVDEVDVIGT